MANLDTINVGGTNYDICDKTARDSVSQTLHRERGDVSITLVDSTWSGINNVTFSSSFSDIPMIELRATIGGQLFFIITNRSRSGFSFQAFSIHGVNETVHWEARD